MNPPAKKEKEQVPERQTELVGEHKTVSIKLSNEMMKAVKEFALKNDMYDWQAFNLLLATGFDALTGDTLKPVAKVTLPAAFDWIAHNTSWVEAKRKRYREILKETQDKIKVELE